MIRVDILAVLFGWALVTTGVIGDYWQQGAVYGLETSSMRQVWGGDAPCYISGDFSCGEAPYGCPNNDCTYNAGTRRWYCNGGSTAEQPEYEHYAESAAAFGGADLLTSKVTTPCNIYWYCGCDTTVMGTPPCSGDPSVIWPHDLLESETFENRKVDYENGNHCPDVGE